MPPSHTIYWDGSDTRAIILDGFLFMEGLDHIVGIIYASPSTMKSIVLAMPEEVSFDYIPEGLGMLRTAYLKFRPLPTEGEVRMVSQDDSTVLRILRQ
jgi:hypothetical protein